MEINLIWINNQLAVTSEATEEDVFKKLKSRMGKIFYTDNWIEVLDDLLYIIARSDASSFAPPQKIASFV